MSANVVMDVLATVRRLPDAVAIETADGASLTYAALERTSRALAARLAHAGVGAGDRVGVFLPKSIAAVVAMFAALRLRAAYVPLDPAAPRARVASIADDCALRVVLVGTLGAWTCAGAERRAEIELVVDLESLGAPGAAESAPTDLSMPLAHEVAYLLYTSGSTGKPKGVVISHENAAAFVEWTWRLGLRCTDRFASIAPFWFDLSVLDVWSALTVGGTVVLFDAELVRRPRELVLEADRRGVTVWYSTPTVLISMLQFGRVQPGQLASIRLLLFAGEVFPPAHLARLAAWLPGAALFNLYGPTETNVCTWYEVDRARLTDAAAVPIGQICPHLEGRIVDESLRPVAAGELGELVIAGPNVSPGYWARAALNEVAWFTAEGRRWYRTGDLVQAGEDGLLRYVARRDRMIKRRGFRIEPGEIEAVIERHPSVGRVAVVPVLRGDERHLVAAVVPAAASMVSTLALRQFCAANLPVYMLPDEFLLLDSLPVGATDKVDLQALSELCR